MFPIEHIGRKLQGTVVALNIFKKPVLTMLWYLEHWSTLYLKQSHKLSSCAIILRMLHQQAVSIHMQLREASSVYRNEIVDNRPGDLGRTSYHAEKDGLQGRFDDI